MRIAINGFGRIGRMTLRALQDKPQVEAEAHLTAGAKKVLITAPAAGGVKTMVRGINDESI